MPTATHQNIRQSLLDRIHAGEWAQGALIPGEVQLAEEYGCARTTVNRALQTLAEEGLVIRRRRGGTRVNHQTMRTAQLQIPLLREQVESTGSHYGHHLTARRKKTPPAAVRTRLRLADGTKALYMETLHLADDRPFAFESRWVNIDAVPEITDAPMKDLSVNEWLVRTVPFSSGDVMFSAANANASVADALSIAVGDATFVVDRTTWLADTFITTMKLHYRPGYQLYSQL
ncbi:MAG: GntR family transcriptional regulator [Woeseiaceae bacterium]